MCLRFASKRQMYISADFNSDMITGLSILHAVNAHAASLWHNKDVCSRSRRCTGNNKTRNTNKKNMFIFKYRLLTKGMYNL